MANEDRIAALRKRVHRQEEEAPMTTAEAVKPTKGRRKSERARHTIYLDKSIMGQVDQAFKDAAHELYPQEIEKADYLEACLAFALAHQDEVRAALTHNAQV
jgi:hypothetical protein